MKPVVVERTIAAPPARVFKFLADLDNHWQLSDRFEPRELHFDTDGTTRGADVLVHGFAGIHRMVHTQVVERTEPHTIRGNATAGNSAGTVDWHLSPAASPQRGTRVQLRIGFTHTAPFERLLMAAGGRYWMTHEGRRILERLDERLRV